MVTCIQSRHMRKKHWKAEQSLHGDEANSAVLHVLYNTVLLIFVPFPCDAHLILELWNHCMYLVILAHTLIWTKEQNEGSMEAACFVHTLDTCKKMSYQTRLYIGSNYCSWKNLRKIFSIHLLWETWHKKVVCMVCYFDIYYIVID